MRLLSLFSGIGAFEKALTNIGIDYELVGFSEIDKWAIESYCAIHGVDKDLNLGDISRVKVEDLPKEIDMITYGFPCQSVSLAGRQDGISKGTRSGLLYEAERIIKHSKPKYAIAENVKNLVGKRHRADFDKLLERLESYGYNNYWEILNAKDYGVPQNRERVFIVSIRKDVDDDNFKFPNRDIQSDISSYLDKKVEDKYNINNDMINADINLSVCCKDAINNPLKNKTKNGWHFEQEVYPNIGLIRAIKAGGGSGNIPKLINNDLTIRKYKPLECWRLMGFDDKDYWTARRQLEEVFYNGGDRSNSQMYKQAGNSIVVDVLEDLLKELLK